MAWAAASTFVALVLLDRRFDLLVERPGANHFTDVILPVSAGLFVLATALAARWPIVGSSVGYVVAGVLAPVAISRLETPSMLLVLVAPTLSASMWALAGSKALDVEHDASRRRLLTVLGAGALAVISGATIGRLIWRRLWRPTHPESSVPPLAVSGLSWIWCGAVTDTSCAIRARPAGDFDHASLLISTDRSLEGGRTVAADGSFDRVVDFRVNDLEPATTYFYAVELDGVLDRVRSGTFRTFPATRANVRIVFASCARTGSNGAVFDSIRRDDPDLYVCLGDFHYGDNFTDDIDAYSEAVDVQLEQPGQSALYRSTPIAYVWDDHDYGPNNSTKRAPGRTAAMNAYRRNVPHYDVAGPTTAIHQAFTTGSVRVVLTDARSDRDPQDQADTADKSMLGKDQRAWLLRELSDSSTEHDLVVWVNPVPWVDNARPGADTWAGYATERTTIAEHIATEGIDNLLMVCGDAHMVAIDDGTNTNYSSTPGPAFPLVHVAALDRPGSIKGGPYTHAPVAGAGQYARIDVTVSDEQSTQVHITAWNWRQEQLMDHPLEVRRNTT